MSTHRQGRGLRAQLSAYRTAEGHPPQPRKGRQRASDTARFPLRGPDMRTLAKELRACATWAEGCAALLSFGYDIDEPRLLDAWVGFGAAYKHMGEHCAELLARLQATGLADPPQPQP